MSDRSEAPVNKWPVNRLALGWLNKANEPANPMAAYVPQADAADGDGGGRCGDRGAGADQRFLCQSGAAADAPGIGDPVGGAGWGPWQG